MVGAPAEEVAEVAEDATDAVLLATELPTAEPLDDAELVTLALTLVKLARRELIDEAEAPVAVASSELKEAASDPTDERTEDWADETLERADEPPAKTELIADEPWDNTDEMPLETAEAAELADVAAEPVRVED